MGLFCASRTGKALKALTNLIHHQAQGPFYKGAEELHLRFILINLGMKRSFYSFRAIGEYPHVFDQKQDIVRLERVLKAAARSNCCVARCL